jgi:hypothetical protein
LFKNHSNNSPNFLHSNFKTGSHALTNMALPVAQLGYMPNLGSPGRGPTTVIDDPWQQLAMQVLGAVVQKGVGNAFEQDYTKQAQNEGLAIDPTAKAAAWYKKPFTGARTDEEQLAKLRGEKQATNRSNAALATSRQEGKADRAARASEGKANRENATGIAQMDNLTRGNIASAQLTAGAAGDEANRTAAMERLNMTIAAEERALGRKLTSEENQAVIRSFIDQAGKITANAPQQTLVQQAINPGSAPVDPNAQIDALAQKLQSMGYQIVPIQR